MKYSWTFDRISFTGCCPTARPLAAQNNATNSMKKSPLLIMVIQTC